MSNAQLITHVEAEQSRHNEAPILKLKQDLESPTQGVAAEALAELRALDPAGLPALLSEGLRAKPPRFFLPVTRREVREREAVRERRLELLRAMASQPAPEFVSVLAQLAGDWDPVIGEAAIAGLRDTAGEAARLALTSLVDHREKRVRHHAAAALASRKEPENLALLLRLLAHGDREIQRQAAIGLGRLDSKEAREALAERFRWAVDTASPALTRWINVMLPILVTGMGVWAHVHPAVEWTIPRLVVVALAGLYVLARQRRRADRRYVAQSLAEQCKAKVPDELITLLPEMSAVETGFWQSDEQTIGAVAQISQAAKKQLEERGNLPVSADKPEGPDSKDLPVASNPPPD